MWHINTDTGYQTQLQSSSSSEVKRKNQLKRWGFPKPSMLELVYAAEMLAMGLTQKLQVTMAGQKQ